MGQTMDATSSTSFVTLIASDPLISLASADRRICIVREAGSSSMRWMTSASTARFSSGVLSGHLAARSEASVNGSLEFGKADDIASQFSQLGCIAQFLNQRSFNN